jgi:general secretion pathway protein N
MRAVFANWPPSRALLAIVVAMIALNASQHAIARDSTTLSLDRLTATRDKPLFSPTRQKPPAVVAPAATPISLQATEAKEAPPKYTLVGLIVGIDAVTVLLRDPNTDELVSVQSGDRVGSWQVVVTSAYSVQLSNGQRKLDLEMFAE